MVCPAASKSRGSMSPVHPIDDAHVCVVVVTSHDVMYTRVVTSNDVSDNTSRNL